MGELLAPFVLEAGSGVRDIGVSGVAVDSRMVAGGELFICVSGEESDGHDYARVALERGATVVATERDIALPAGTHEVRVASGRRAVARAADRFFGSPSRQIYLVGITGTNGKTTVSYLAREILEGAGRRTALFGTVEYAWGRERRAALHTTPGPLELQALLREAVDAGMTAAVMEVSSHGLAQERVADLDFDIALFTNLSHDHLDYHGTMDKYRDAKASFFDASAPYGASRRAVLNVDDPVGRELASGTPLPVVTFGVRNPADVRAEIHAADLDGLDLEIAVPAGTRRARLAMAGVVNASNAAAAAAVGWTAGVTPDEIASGLARIRGVPGRMEAVRAGQPFGVIVDFAHTPDALERLLQGLRPLCRGRMSVVFGCGGDRDVQKRPVMGEIACRLADRVIVTNDNPRSEDPLAIAEAILAGCGDRRAVATIELDRAAAVVRAIDEAGAGDVVVIAGKGHERYQIIGKERRAFDDRAVARDALRARGYSDE